MSKKRKVSKYQRERVLLRKLEKRVKLHTLARHVGIGLWVERFNAFTTTLQRVPDAKLRKKLIDEFNHLHDATEIKDSIHTLLNKPTMNGGK